MDDWHVGSPALWIDMPETLFVKNDDTNDFSDVVNLTVGWAAVDATNGVLELDMRFQDDDAAVYADQELTERVLLPLLMDGREPCETNFYIVGLRESTAYANNAVTLAWHDGDGDLLGRTERTFTVLSPIADVVNNSLYSGGELCNPAAIVAGTNAPFAITFSTLYPPEETIVWSVEEGDAEFVGGMNTGSCVRVSSLATNTAVTLNVQIGDAISRPVKFRAYVVEPLSVKTTVWIVGDDNGSYYACDAESVSNMMTGVNKIYEQIGVSFYLDSISFTNAHKFLDLSYSDGKCNLHRRRKLVSCLSNTGGLEVYFVDKISNRANADHDRFGIVVSTNATAKSIAHEFGHAFGCVDVYHVQKSNKSTPLHDRSVIEAKAYQDWSNGVVEEAPGTAFAAAKMQAFRGGFEFTPNRYDMRYWYKHITYRAGAYHEKSYYSFNGHQVASTGVTFGISFPVFRYFNSVNLGVDIGQRGSLANNLIRERYFKFMVSFALHDIWFLKPMYE